MKDKQLRKALADKGWLWEWSSGRIEIASPSASEIVSVRQRLDAIVKYLGVEFFHVSPTPGGYEMKKVKKVKK